MAILPMPTADRTGAMRSCANAKACLFWGPFCFIYTLFYIHFVLYTFCFIYIHFVLYTYFVLYIGVVGGGILYILYRSMGRFLATIHPIF